MAATEAGAAYVAIIPSAKGFARALKKTIAKEFAGSDLDKVISDAFTGAPVSVPVKPQVSPGDVPDEVPVRPGREPTLPVRLDPLTRQLQADVRRELGALTSEAVKIDLDADTEGLRAEIADAITAVETTLSADIPTDPADRAQYERQLRDQVAEVSRRVRAQVDVDIDAKGLLRDGTLDTAGESIGRSLAGSIVSSLGSGIGLIAGPTVFIGLIIAAGVAAPLIAATLAAGILTALGGGIIGLALVSLGDDPRFQKAATGLSKTVKDTFAKAAAPLLGTEDKPGPLLLAMQTISDLVVELGPSLEQMFASIGPYIPTLAAGLAEFVRAVMPGLLAAVEASGPILEAIAFNLGPLGESLGKFLITVAELGPAAVDAISVIFTVLEHVLAATGAALYILGAFFSSVYDWLHTAVENAALFWAFFTDIFEHGSEAVSKVVLGLIAGTVRLFRGMPGQIRSALGDLGGLLTGAGRRVIEGLINGIRARFPNLRSIVAEGVQIIRDHLPFSPAKTGPLSGRGNPYYSGRSIVDLLAGGITGNLGTAERAAADLAGTFALGGSPVATAPAGGHGALVATTAPAAMRVEWVGGDGDPIIRAIREHTRIYYDGDPDLAFGS